MVEASVLDNPARLGNPERRGSYSALVLLQEDINGSVDAPMEEVGLGGLIIGSNGFLLSKVSPK